MTDVESMEWLTNDEQSLATIDNAPLWRALALLREQSSKVVLHCERLDHHGTSRAIDVDYLRGVASVLPSKPVVVGDIADAHRFYRTSP